MKNILFNQEFSWNITHLLGQAYYCYTRDIPYKAIASKNMATFLWFVKNLEIQNIHTIIDFPLKRFYYKNQPDRQVFDGVQFPLLKSHFYQRAIDLGLPKLFTKPVVAINNKYISEWHAEPAIYLDTQAVLGLCDKLSSKYDIVYIRAHQNEKGYDTDPMQRDIYELDDYEQLKKHFPQVVCLNDFDDEQYNLYQAALLACADKHIAVAGGNSCLSAYFADELLIKNSNHPKTVNRGIWHDNSWLSKIAGAKIKGFLDSKPILEYIEQW